MKYLLMIILVGGSLQNYPLKKQAYQFLTEDPNAYFDYLEKVCKAKPSKVLFCQIVASFSSRLARNWLFCRRTI